MRRAKQLDCNCVTSPTVNETPPSRTKRTPHGRNQFNLSMRITGADECYWSQAREPLREISGSSNFPQTLNSPHKLITKFQQAPFHWSSTSTDCFPFRGPMLQFPLPPPFLLIFATRGTRRPINGRPTDLHPQRSTVHNWTFHNDHQILAWSPMCHETQTAGQSAPHPTNLSFCVPVFQWHQLRYISFQLQETKDASLPFLLLGVSHCFSTFPRLRLPLSAPPAMESLGNATLRSETTIQLRQPQSDGMLNMIANRLLQTILTNQPWIS